jgi:hypothetical protein
VHIAWCLALMIVLQEREEPLTEQEAANFLYVVWRRTVPLEFDNTLKQVREILEDHEAARKKTT